MKKMLRIIVRKVLRVRDFETISDALVRKKYGLLKKMNHNSVTTLDFFKKIVELGLSKGDVVILHSSWRALVGYNGSPKELIDCILKIIGNEGTLLMPAYTDNKDLFKYDDPTSAGFIAEFFRKNYPVCRSLNNVFSMCALGKYANYFTKDHIRSLYYFDNESPYYRAIEKNAKVLLIGLGKKPHKISLFHCVSYDIRNDVKCYNDVYTMRRKGVIYDKHNKKNEVEFFDRWPQYQNCHKRFRWLFLHFINRNNYGRINKTDIYLFDAKKMYNQAKKYVVENNFNLYK